MDLENPNARGNSICSIAIIVIKNNKIIDKKYSLINPEDRFDIKNSEITGITPNMVLKSPTLKEYWHEIKELLENNVIVGHNVIYDLSVLSKSLNRYNIDVPVFNYCCTLEWSRQYLNLDSYKLTSIAQFLNVNYNPHNALEDATATYYLFKYLNEHYNIDNLQTKQYEYEFIVKDNFDSKLTSNINSLYGIIKGINYDGIINQYEMGLLNNWIDENMIYKQYSLFNKIITELSLILEDGIITEYEKIELLGLVNSIQSSNMYNETTLNLQILQGILEGIACDKKIVIEEIENLKIWLIKNDYLSGVYPYDKILLIVNKVLEDGILTENEKEELALSFNEILNPVCSNKKNIELNGKTFCLTGDFKSGTKSEMKQRLEDLGAIEKSGVSAKLNYLFVGGLGSEAWKYGNIGGKIAKAQELQEKGSLIQIISEEDLLNSINDMLCV